MPLSASPLTVSLQNVADLESGASGVVDFELNSIAGDVCYEVTSNDIDGTYRSHIHAGGLSVDGGIVVDLGPLESGAKGCVDNLPVYTNAVLADLVDTDGGGAWILLDQGSIYLEGDVPDQATADDLALSVAGAIRATPVVNNLQVIDGAPVPRSGDHR